MRPRTLDEFVGQEHFLGPGKLLRRLLEADRLASVIFYGPPGTGKTALAHVIANQTQCLFRQLNAVATGVKEVRVVLDEARAELADTGRRTILFIDELHRFSRTQQDVLLPDVEEGRVILIGATTQNPFFAINSPLLSRSQIFTFEALTPEQIKTILLRAIGDRERGLGQREIHISDEALAHHDLPNAAPIDRANFLFAEGTFGLLTLLIFLYVPLELALHIFTRPYLEEMGSSGRTLTRLVVAFWCSFLVFRFGLCWIMRPGVEPWLVLTFLAITAMLLGNLTGAYAPNSGYVGYGMVGAFCGPIAPALLAILFDIEYPRGSAGQAFGLVFASAAASFLIFKPLLEMFAKKHRARECIRIPMLLTLAMAAPIVVLALVRATR